MRVVNRFQNIKPERIIQIRGIKINDIIQTAGWDKIQNLFGRIPVRVNVGAAMPGLDVADNHIFHQIRLAHSGLSQNIHMPAAVVGFNAKTPLLIAEIRKGKRNYFVFMVVIVHNENLES